MSTTPFTWQTAAFTGSTKGTILTAGVPSSGAIANGNILGSSGLLVTATIGTQLTGTTGGTGTYNVAGLPPLVQSTGLTAQPMTTAATFTTATGQSQGQVAPANAKQATIIAYMGATAGNATVSVVGSVDGGTHNVTLGSFMLTGANAIGSYTMPSQETLFYDTIALNITALTAGQVAGFVRYR